MIARTIDSRGAISVAIEVMTLGAVTLVVLASTDQTIDKENTDRLRDQTCDYKDSKTSSIYMIINLTMLINSFLLLVVTQWIWNQQQNYHQQHQHEERHHDHIQRQDIGPNAILDAVAVPLVHAIVIPNQDAHADAVGEPY